MSFDASDCFRRGSCGRLARKREFNRGGDFGSYGHGK